MRNFLVLMATTALAACGADAGSGGVQSAGGAAVGGGAAAGGGTTGGIDYTQFATPTVAKSYNGVGGSHAYTYTEINTVGLSGVQQQPIYSGNASTVRNSQISISYDPRAATFTLNVTDPLSRVTSNTRFQDPASRTNFGGTVEPQWGVPDVSKFAGVGANSEIAFLEAGDGSPNSPYQKSGSGTITIGSNSVKRDGFGPGSSSVTATTFFYQKPGLGTARSTTYVTYAGFVRNELSFTDPAQPNYTVSNNLQRGAFAYGLLTDTANVPKTGTATYSGGMLATMVGNPTLDGQYGTALPTYFQWISGTSTTTVDFAKSTFGLTLSGTVGDAFYDNYTSPKQVTWAAGTTFTATGSGSIDLVATGGFTGQFQSASFGASTNGAPGALLVAGSSIDGAFYGPKANEVGGGFRIVGGTPDQRIDIIGAFTGKGN